MFNLVITSWGRGLGGHFYDCREFADELHSRGCEFDMLEIYRHERSPVLRQCPAYSNIAWGSGLLGFWSSLRGVAALLNNGRITICFDVEALFLVRLCGLGDKATLFKCGGANLPKLPRTKKLIVTNQDNYNFYRSHGRSCYDVGPVVRTLEGSDADTVRSIPRRILRIGRISKTYSGLVPIFESLAAELNSTDLDLTLEWIGVVEDEEMYSRLLRINGLCLRTTPDFTVDAARHYSKHDLAICTGRGALEAAARGARVACFSTLAKLPVLVTQENFLSFAKVNFSLRASVAGSDTLETLIHGEQNAPWQFFNDRFDGLIGYLTSSKGSDYSRLTAWLDYLTLSLRVLIRGWREPIKHSR